MGNVSTTNFLDIYTKKMGVLNCLKPTQWGPTPSLQIPLKQHLMWKCTYSKQTYLLFCTEWDTDSTVIQLKKENKTCIASNILPRTYLQRFLGSSIYPPWKRRKMLATGMVLSSNTEPETRYPFMVLFNLSRQPCIVQFIIHQLSYQLWNTHGQLWNTHGWDTAHSLLIS
jgi:hypothetical protein